MPTNLENSAVATGLEKVSFHSNPKETESEVTQSCPTLFDPMDYSLPGSSLHGIFWATVLEWGAIAFSHFKYSSMHMPIPTFQFISHPGIEPGSPTFQADTLTSEPPGSPNPKEAMPKIA